MGVYKSKYTGAQLDAQLDAVDGKQAQLSDQQLANIAAVPEKISVADLANVVFIGGNAETNS